MFFIFPDFVTGCFSLNDLAEDTVTHSFFSAFLNSVYPHPPHVFLFLCWAMKNPSPHFGHDFNSRSILSPATLYFWNSPLGVLSAIYSSFLTSFFFGSAFSNASLLAYASALNVAF